VQAAVTGVRVGLLMEASAEQSLSTIPLFTKVMHNKEKKTFLGEFQVEEEVEASLVFAELPSSAFPISNAVVVRQVIDEEVSWRVVVNDDTSTSAKGMMGYAADLVTSVPPRSVEVVEPPEEAEPSHHPVIAEMGLVDRMHHLLRRTMIQTRPVYDLMLYLQCCTGTLREVGVVGGAVRDTVYGKGDIADVDIVVACSGTDLVNHLRSYLKLSGSAEDKIQLSVKMQAFGSFKISRVYGDGDDLDVAEFKGLRVFYTSSAAPNGPVRYTYGSSRYTRGFSFRWDHLSRDFTVNALYFCMSGAFFDPTGHGFDDAQKKIARFACPGELHWDLGGCFRLWKMKLTKEAKKGEGEPKPLYTVDRDSFWLVLGKLSSDLTRFRGELEDAKLKEGTRFILDEQLTKLQTAIGSSGVTIPARQQICVPESFDEWCTKLQGKLFRDKLQFSSLYARAKALDGAFRDDDTLHKHNQLFWRCVRYMCKAWLENEKLTSESPSLVITALAFWNRNPKAPIVDVYAIPPHLVSMVKNERGEKRRLGQGNFGKVFLGRYNHQDVAIKEIEFEGAPSKEDKQMVEEEARRHCAVEHDNVVSCYGLIQHRFAIVMESVPPSLLKAVTGKRLTEGQLFCAALQIARGMRAIHEADMTHGDLRAANVMVGPIGNRRCRITDFGLSRMMTTGSTSYAYGPVVPGPAAAGGADEQQSTALHWRAPEWSKFGDSTLKKELLEKTDVFSFGIVMYEMISGGKTPCSGAADSEVVRNYWKERYGFGTFKDEWSKPYVELMKECLRCDRQFYQGSGPPTDAKRRPSFAEIVKRIEGLPFQIDEELVLE